MTDLMANVMDGVEQILGPSDKRAVTLTEKCPNERCNRGHVMVDTGMRWINQICPTCFGDGRVRVSKPAAGSDVAITGSHDYGK